MLTQAEVERIVGFISQQTAREIDAAIRRISLAVVGRVATAAEAGVTPLRNVTSPNGDTITNGEAAVYINVEAPGGDNYIWCPVRRGVTVTAGDVVRVVRNYPNSTDWWIDAKL